MAQAEPSKHADAEGLNRFRQLFAGAMPKEEVGALSFLKDHPTYDGRGVVVAIFDTGVDPGAKGLQETSDGKPKILDIVDGTGSGDVDTSKAVEADGEGFITGIYGNRLKVNPSWQNPTGKWHVGAKRAFQLFPSTLANRLKTERRKSLDEQQRAAATAANAALAAVSDKKKLSEGDKKEKAELEGRVKLLGELLDKFEDAGPMLDCVVWHDGEAWRAALDTSDMYQPGSEKGLLADFKPLTNYKAEQQYGTFSAEDACNFVLNIYDEGNVLSIVVDAGPHGTHVAGITAAYHPGEPELNGIAPGAQLVSCKIGDSRLGSMETGTGLTRGLISVLENRCDLINMSYGEPTANPNAGRFIDLATEVVNKHGVIFVSSAGNAGPALGTVGAPGGTTSAILSVGAYVTPRLAEAGHSLRAELPEGQQYTWSSRGPTADGAIGVDISAPGGAIAPVPQWTQQCRQLMNGTSMASPNACGGIALILSGLKAEGCAISPNRVRRGVENTCLPLGGDRSDAVLTYGRGLIQVDKAFDYLVRAAEADKPDVRYDVTVRRTDGTVSQRGVLLREPRDTLHPVNVQVEVKPAVREGADTKMECCCVEDQLVLRSTAPWLEAPDLLLLPFGGRSFELRVDASELPEGLHYAEVQATDSKAPWRGPSFRVPVTVIKPTQVEELEARLPDGAAGTPSSSSTDPAHADDYVARLGTISFQPGTEERRFVSIPEGATWATLRVRAGAHDAPRAFMLRATQLLPQTRYSDTEARAYVTLAAYAAHHMSLEVAGGGTLEITLSQFWSSLGPGALDVQVKFHGIVMNPGSVILLDGNRSCIPVQVRASLRAEKLQPSAKLRSVRIPLRPSESLLVPLRSPRDTLPEGRTIHSLTLTYKLNVAEAGKHTPSIPLLNRYVYDGVLEAQMSMLFDTNKRLLKVNDIYPEAVQLSKGDYIIRLYLRHDDSTLLAKLKNLPMIVDRKLGDAITVPIYNSQAEALKNSNGTAKERTLYPGEGTSYYVGPVPEDKLPKDAMGGRLLIGSITFGKQPKETGGGDAPCQASLAFLVPPKVETPPADKDGGNSEEEAKKKPEEKLAEALRDARVKFLKDNAKSCEGEDKEYFNNLRRRLLQDFPQHLPLLLERLNRVAASEGEERKAALQDIVAAADAVVAAIDVPALATYLAQKSPEEGPGAAKRKKEMDEQKAALVEALEKKATALLEIQPSPPSPSASQGAEAAEEDVFEACFQELRKWVDPAEGGTALLLAKREARAGRFASAFKALDKLAAPEDKAGSREVLDYRAGLLQQLGWAHWHRHETSRLKDLFPPSYPLF